MAQSLVGSLLLSLRFWYASNSTGLQSQIPWRFSVPLLDPQVGECLVGSRTFATVWKLLWYNCSPVWGSSAWWIYGGANDDLLQEDLCHMQCLPGLLQPEPSSPWQPLLVCDSAGNTHSKADVVLSLVGSLGPGAHKVLFESTEHLWCVWALTLNTILPILPPCWGFSFALGHGYLFLVGSNFLLYKIASATSCNFGVPQEYVGQSQILFWVLKWIILHIKILYMICF